MSKVVGLFTPSDKKAAFGWFNFSFAITDLPTLRSLMVEIPQASVGHDQAAWLGFPVAEGSTGCG